MLRTCMLGSPFSYERVGGLMVYRKGFELSQSFHQCCVLGQGSRHQGSFTLNVNKIWQTGLRQSEVMMPSDPVQIQKIMPYICSSHNKYGRHLPQPPHYHLQVCVEGVSEFPMLKSHGPRKVEGMISVTATNCSLKCNLQYICCS